MTLKATGNELSFSDIEAEFGQNGSRSLGGYRLTQSVGSLSNLPLDSGIPTSGQIKFSDFYSKQLNVVVDCHSGSREDRKSAKGDKWNNNAVTVIGGFRSRFGTGLGSREEQIAEDRRGFGSESGRREEKRGEERKRQEKRGCGDGARHVLMAPPMRPGAPGSPGHAPGGGGREEKREKKR